MVFFFKITNDINYFILCTKIRICNAVVAQSGTAAVSKTASLRGLSVQIRATASINYIQTNSQQLFIGDSKRNK